MIIFFDICEVVVTINKIVDVIDIGKHLLVGVDCSNEESLLAMAAAWNIDSTKNVVLSVLPRIIRICWILWIQTLEILKLTEDVIEFLVFCGDVQGCIVNDLIELVAHVGHHFHHCEERGFDHNFQLCVRGALHVSLVCAFLPILQHVHTTTRIIPPNWPPSSAAVSKFWEYIEKLRNTGQGSRYDLRIVDVVPVRQISESYQSIH